MKLYSIPRNLLVYHNFQSPLPQQSFWSHNQDMRTYAWTFIARNAPHSPTREGRVCGYEPPFSQRVCSGSQTWKQSLRYTTRLGQQQPESLWTGRVPRHPWQLDLCQYPQQSMVDVAGYSKWYSDTHLAMLEEELCECVGWGSNMVGRGQMEYFRVSLCQCICSCSMNDVNEYCLLNNIK